YWLLLSTLPN
ncbi:putative inner membrane protein, partial [Chlamydia psittaci C6/98]